jgi:hypothetical protein
MKCPACNGTGERPDPIIEDHIEECFECGGHGQIMKTYQVLVREVHIQGYVVEAEDPEDAVELVRYGSGDLNENMFEYSHTLEPELWTVEEVPEPEEETDVEFEEDVRDFFERRNLGS